MSNVTFAYKKNPDDIYERDVTMTFGADVDLRYGKLVEMFVDFSRVLGYADSTIERYISMEEFEDDE